MKRIFDYDNDPVRFIESSVVTEGVVCDVYEFTDDKTKDLGIVRVSRGNKTPLQKVLSGEKTIEVFESGSGVLTVVDTKGEKRKYVFPSEQKGVEIKIGETMQWKAIDDLVFYEVCYPPYKEGRFQNLSE